MAKTQDVPDIVIGRLPVYLRALDRLAGQGLEITSSQQLGELLGVSSAQIRKDLSHFGEFGKQGTGYTIDSLRQQLAAILQVDREWKVVMVGTGAVAEALLRENRLGSKGFRIVALFDTQLQRVGLRLHGLEILHIEQLSQVVSAEGLQVAIIAVEAQEAQDTADRLVSAGLRAILSYAPITLSVPQEVQVQTIDPVALLQRMTYYL